jgi:large subunit ribosomal protein L31e
MSEKSTLERVYNVPLRKEFQKVPVYKRAKKAVSAMKSFLSRHMKSDEVKLGVYLNEKIWERGIKNPPHHVKVKAIKYEDGKVFAELVDAPIVEKTKEEAKKVKEKTPESKEQAEEEKSIKENKESIKENKEDSNQKNKDKKQEVIEESPKTLPPKPKEDKKE